MKGMILAAGFGTRLGELGVELPKPLFPVCNVPLIRYAVSLLVGHGITEIVVNLHHLGELIQRELGDGAELGAEIRYAMEEGQILGTGGGVKNVADFFGGETFVVMNGKIVSDVDLHAAVAHHRETGAEATMVLKPDPNAAQWGAIGVDDHGRVRRFLGTAGPWEDVADDTVTEHMFTGIHVLEPSFLDRLPDGPCCIVRAGYVPAFKAGASLSGFVHRGYFWDHSTPSRLLEGNLNLVSGRGRAAHPPGPTRGIHDTATVHPDAELAESALVGADARVDAGARLGPDVVLGPRAHVAPGVCLSRTVVLADGEAGRNLDQAVVAPGGHVTQIDLTDAGPRIGPALKK